MIEEESKEMLFEVKDDNENKYKVKSQTRPDLGAGEAQIEFAAHARRNNSGIKESHISLVEERAQYSQDLSDQTVNKLLFEDEQNSAIAFGPHDQKMVSNGAGYQKVPQSVANIAGKQQKAQAMVFDK